MPLLLAYPQLKLPKTVTEELAYPGWRHPMFEEMIVLHDHSICIVPLPEGKVTVDC